MDEILIVIGHGSNCPPPASPYTRSAELKKKNDQAEKALLTKEETADHRPAPEMSETIVIIDDTYMSLDAAIEHVQKVLDLSVSEAEQFVLDLPSETKLYMLYERACVQPLPYVAWRNYLIQEALGTN